MEGNQTKNLAADGICWGGRWGGSMGQDETGLDPYAWSRPNTFPRLQRKARFCLAGHPDPCFFPLQALWPSPSVELNEGKRALDPIFNSQCLHLPSCPSSPLGTLSPMPSFKLGYGFLD
ncbi:hypothetical protein J3458_020304 [Metarhizium acridum]|uniref:uncharacterized protein n=1 Tax=Metarhizium acridum TaxID=92637 RepID=UPI001C6B3301|nr:hypothetical protein J3458_020304 [Metarhizium acridum]